MTDDKSVKILVRYYSDVLEEETVETLWARVIDESKGLYQIDNIPFYGPPFSSDDIVFAEYDDYEERLTYRKVVTHSGNSTVQVVLMDRSKDIMEIRNVLEKLNCESEGISQNFFSLEIPAFVNYKKIKEILSELENQGMIGYAEPNLSDKHRQEVNSL